ncbi:MAG: hypothetical protein JNJ54_04600 [Myxococcaceae bacterium]|nr:hypothetical protein [Myxococcaceae bacterium]
MISLALRGKLPVTEDPLTAAFADLLRYQSDAGLLRAVLGIARPNVAGMALPADFDGFDVELWPILAGREPDVRLCLTRDNAPLACVIIEAKLGAEKSGTGEVSTEDRSGDQLAYYLLHEADRAPLRPTALLYLTHHGAMPYAALRESAEELIRQGREHLAQQLFWVSWKDVHDVLSTRASQRVVSDFIALLRKVSMYRFKSYTESVKLGNLLPPTFYAGQRRARSYIMIGSLLGSLSRWSYEARKLRRSYQWQSPPAPRGASNFYTERS